MILSLGALSTTTLSQEYTLSRWTIDGGGVMHSTGGAFELSGTIGQPDAGTMTRGAFELNGGFWFALTPADCNEDGAADLHDYAAFRACLDGPSGGVAGGCECFDLDGSGTIDLRDFAGSQNVFYGE